MYSQWALPPVTWCGAPSLGVGRGPLIPGRRAEHAGRGPEDADMFERFTDRARRVVVLAQEEARMLNHNYIGTEHILLGLIHEARASPPRRSNR